MVQLLSWLIPLAIDAASLFRSRNKIFLGLEVKMNVKSLAYIFGAFALLTLTACGDRAESVKLQGAGASFPAPLYLKWFKSFGAVQPNVQVDYQSVGSGSGVKSFMDRTVDFAASDAAMKPEDIAKVDGGVQLLPMTAGSIVLAHSLKDVRGSHYIGRIGAEGIQVGRTHQRLGRHVNDNLRLGKGQHACDQGGIGDVAEKIVRSPSRAQIKQVWLGVRRQ